MPNYNHIAWIYDWLAKIVFGGKQELAKQAFLARIPDKANILVVGGGTGKIIDYLGDLNQQLDVDFVEQSANMMFYARKRAVSHLKINFHQQSILDYKAGDYDVVLTNFFFDQFSQGQAQLILQHLKAKLIPKGILIFSDFIHNNHICDRFVTRIMFVFFQLTVGIRTNTYPPYNYMFSSQGFSTGESKKINRNILAATYSIGSPDLS
jgi:ubiquinone/menaquinone biosynthesis C-methylase UbiE